jgi:hypothetical protein
MNRKDKELRDWYAGLARQALIGVREWDSHAGELIVSEALYMAKEMMEQRQTEMGAEMDAEINAVMASKPE